MKNYKDWLRSLLQDIGNTFLDIEEVSIEKYISSPDELVEKAMALVGGEYARNN